VLGSTGSIGRQVLDVASRLKDDIRIVALAANKNAAGVAEQARALGVKLIGLVDPEAAREARDIFAGTDVKVVEGIEGLCELSTMPEADIVVVGVAGVAGFKPTVSAIEAGKTIALASKEVLVAGGELITKMLERKKVPLLPIDSEHSAIFQCLQGSRPEQIEKILLTASGGPFANSSASDLHRVTVDEALQHPTWQMGSLVTINSATLMNKGLEVIEAHWLFGVDVSQIEVVIHPQSIVHSMVQFKDGSILGQLGLPDMRLPIQYALLYPERLDSHLPRLDLTKVGGLTFTEPDTQRFPCLTLAYHAARTGKTMPTVMNGANEAAVELFLQRKIALAEIPRIIQIVMTRHNPVEVSFESIVENDQWARKVARQVAVSMAEGTGQ
jgi:1-deoxy-D-xylulose-5-phosphate reductoisomerase